MTIRLGKDSVSMLNPPTAGLVYDREGRKWNIKRNGQGMIVLRPDFSGYQAHPDFVPLGMSLEQFCWWINQQLQ